ncbi:hypothetical protein [Bradyrhizobium arachidis]|uniref:hypothetical protein n=1 Tax=Bradyrhizobium arachidis TaxID=858423 RepID=UPI0021616493|nr:hypothetical protein [Bradyrhizobium arachidis]UVO30215.1 hypothetical protein KUF59_05485 [Bradyrhizobium arachidis]
MAITQRSPIPVPHGANWIATFSIALLKSHTGSQPGSVTLSCDPRIPVTDIFGHDIILERLF